MTVPWAPLPASEMRALKRWTRSERQIAGFRRLLDIAGIDPAEHPAIGRELRRLRRRADRLEASCTARVEPMPGLLQPRKGVEDTMNNLSPTTSAAQAPAPPTALIRRDASLPALSTLPSFEQALTLGKVFADSGFFKDVKTQAQAVVKIMMGAELGLPAITSMSGLNVIEGKVSISAGLMSTIIQRSGIFAYRVVQLDERVCELEFSRDGKILKPNSIFTMADADKIKDKWGEPLSARLMWKNYPRNMLFARAMSNGYRWHCGALSGGPIYTNEELADAIDVEAETVGPTPADPRTALGGNSSAGPETVEGEIVEDAERRQPEQEGPRPSAEPQAAGVPTTAGVGHAQSADEIRAARWARARELALRLVDSTSGGEHLAGWYAHWNTGREISNDQLADQIIEDMKRCGLKLGTATAGELLHRLTGEDPTVAREAGFEG